jgi:hypothetical protein
VVRTAIDDPARGETARWFDAVLTALAGAVGQGAIGGWTISVEAPAGDIAGWVSALEPYRESAVGAGGELEIPSPYSPAADQLTLALDRMAMPLTSTIVRLVRGLDGGATSARARQVPLDEPNAPGGACVLSRGPLAPSERGVALYRPEAVAHVDARLASAPPSDDRGTAGGSLVESRLDGDALAGIRGDLSGILGRGDDDALTVIMRTQGARPEALRDALLSLAGQTDDRFELLLVVHDGDADAVSRVLDDQPGHLRARTRLLDASGGTRSHPLNVGIAEARYGHIAFLDDDDLVFAHWVETFLGAARSHPRSLLRASVAVQWSSSTAWPGDVEGFRNATEITTPYPPAFDLADHLRVNMTPFMGFAFPAGFFAVFGGADEGLDVCEDWDLGLRAASVLGVVDFHEPTAIYRRWESGRDSYTSHDDAQWQRDMHRVMAKLDRSVILLPPGSASELARLSAARDSHADLREVYASTSWRMTAPLRTIVTAVSRLRRR